jgi:hypothetical protein
VIFRRRRFGELIERQLGLWAEEHAGFLRDVDAAERAYDEAERDGAEERYGDYLDLVETGTELLASVRDAYAATLDEDTAVAYEAEFNRAVVRRWPRFGLEIEET